MKLYFKNPLLKVAAITLFMGSSAWAAPSVSSISGTFSNGQDITISGSGFGANGPSVAMFDDFEAGTINQTIGTGAGNLANVGKWEADGSYPGYYTSSAAVSGTKAMGINWKTPLASKDVRVRLSGATDLFISYWWHVPSGSDFPGENGGEGTNWKQIWAYKNDDISGGDQTFVSILGSGGPPENAFAFYETCDACPTSQYGNISLPMKNQWHRVWFYIKGSETTNGEMDYWDLNPSGGIVQNIHTTGVATLNAGAVYNWASVPGYGRNNSSGGSWAEYDDVYIATAASGNGQARIEICDTSDYASASMSKITLATPKTWSTGSITATVRGGQFSAGQTGYVFVFDNTGAHNATGFAATFGNSGGTNLHPTNTGTTQTSLSFSWDSVTANQLAVIDDNSDFSSPISSATTTSPQTYNSLTCNTQYYFEVKVPSEPDSGYTSTNATTNACSTTPIGLKGTVKGSGKVSGNGKFR